jgi:hypothetical protein
MITNWVSEKRRLIEEATKQYEECLATSKENLELIKTGVAFGFTDHWEYGSYFPLELIEVVSEEDCMIKVYERSTKKEDIVCTYGLVIDSSRKAGIYNGNSRNEG